MKKYNVKNYIRYKEDLKLSIANVPVKNFIDYSPKELKVIFLPLVENIGRKFATSQEASGVMSIMDIIQEGSLQLCKAVDKIDRNKLFASENVETTLKSFLAKRIRGGIRREIDRNRGTMRIPEHKLNEMRKGKDEKMVRMFFNSIFLSYDAKQNDEDMVYQIPDKSDSIEKLSQATTFIGADENVENLKDITKINASRKRKNHLVIKLILLKMTLYK